MMPRLGEKYQVEIEVISKPNSEYLTDDYFALDLPVAPAVMIGDDILVEGSDISDFELESALCRNLGLPVPEKKSMLSRLLGK
jgi:hypothetical protein